MYAAVVLVLLTLGISSADGQTQDNMEKGVVNVTKELLLNDYHHSVSEYLCHGDKRYLEDIANFHYEWGNYPLAIYYYDEFLGFLERERKLGARSQYFRLKNTSDTKNQSATKEVTAFFDMIFGGVYQRLADCYYQLENCDMGDKMITHAINLGAIPFILDDDVFRNTKNYLQQFRRSGGVDFQPYLAYRNLLSSLRIYIYTLKKKEFVKEKMKLKFGEKWSIDYQIFTTLNDAGIQRIVNKESENLSCTISLEKYFISD